MLDKIKNILILFVSLSSMLIACINCDIPVSDAGEDQTYYLGSTVTLDGSNSYDSEGSELTYLWQSLEGVEIVGETTANPSFTFSDPFCSDGESINEEDCCLNNYVGCSDEESLTAEDCCLNNYVGCSDEESLTAEDCCLNNYAGCSDEESLTAEDCCLNNYVGCSDEISVTGEDCCLNNYIGCSDGISTTEQNCCLNEGEGEWFDFIGCIDGISQTHEACCNNNGGDWEDGGCTTSGEVEIWNFYDDNCSDWGNATWSQSSWDGEECQNGTATWGGISSWNADTMECDQGIETWIQSSWDGSTCSNSTETWVQSSWDGSTCSNSTETWMQSSWNGAECLNSNAFWNEAPLSLRFNLVVNDGSYDSDPDQVMITISDVNTPPVIDVQTSFEVNKNSEFTIDASGTYDETLHASGLQYSWTYPSFVLVDGASDNISSISLISPSVTEDQQFPIELSVTDGVDTVNEAILVDVIANIRPYASPGEDINIGEGAIFTLNGTSSYDSDGTINTYLWSLPSGITESDIASGSVNDASLDIVAPFEQDDYIFSLIVTDDAGEQSLSYNSTNLFISEYAHASASANRYLEIYNGTENSIDLSEYQIIIYRDNGNEYTLDLNNNGAQSNNSSGMLNPGEVLIIIKSDSGDLVNDNDPYIGSNAQFIEWSSLSNLGGNDAIELLHNGQRIDVVGDPENYEHGEWGIGGTDFTTDDVTLVRKDGIVNGATVWSNYISNSNIENGVCIFEEGDVVGCNQWVAYDRNTFDYGGSHYCSICDNLVTVTVSNNSSPTAVISESDFSAYVGSTISLDGSASTDPENTSLTYNWTSNYDGLIIIDANTHSPSFVVPSAADETPIVFSLEVSDGVNSNTSNVTITVVTVNQPPIVIAEIEKMNFDGNDIAYINEVYEDYTIYFDGSLTQDNGSSTGILTYTWSAPALDYNNDGENDIIFSDPSSANTTIEIGEYYGSDRSYQITLEVSDGDQTASEVINMELVARMPMISVDTPTLTGYENQYMRMEVLSTQDPNGDINDLEFDWSGSNSQTLGVCVSGDEIIDSNGNQIGSENYNDTDWCNSTSDCNGHGTCSRKKAVAFRLLPTSIGENTDYTITVSAEDDDDYDSESASITITSVARYPVANAGVDISYVMGEKMYLYGHMSHDPQEELVSFSYWNDSDAWQTDESVGVTSFYNDTFVCEKDMLTSCLTDDDCDDSDCIVKLTAKDGYTFTWIPGSGGPDGGVPEELFDLIKNDVNPCFSCIASYEDHPELYPDDLFDECFLNQFTGDYVPNTWEQEYELVITDNTECSVNCDNDSGPNDAGVSLESTNSSEVTFTLVQNCPPVADAGKNIVYNRGKAQEIEEYTSDFRAHTGYEYTLDGSRSSDSTPIGELNYLWTSRGYCPEGYSDFSECASSDVVLSDETAVDPSFTVPSDLCVEGEYITEKSCCENNEGVWLNEGNCSLPDLWNNDGKTLTFTLQVNDGYLTSEEDIITVTYNAYSIPAQPLLYATGTHFDGDESGTINLFWENSAENSIDDLTQYADFQGYKIFRSENYGQTWGTPTAILDGEILGWEPYAQFDMSQEQDSTYCLYKNDNKDCGFDSYGNEISAAELNRYNEISGIVDWVDGFAWQNLGSNEGLSQTLIDEDVIDGVDYTYTITAYDRGVRPDTLLYGHYGKLNGTTWDDDEWVVNSQLYTFHDTMAADTFFLYKLNHKIIESIIIGPNTDLNPSDNEEDPDVEVNGKEVLQNTHYFVLEPPDEWNVGEENEYVSMSDIEQGVAMGWETTRGAPVTNPYGYPGKESLESSLGTSVEDKNFVTISSDYYATNVSFPTDENLDDFISANCKAVGNGDQFYEIVNEEELDTSLVRFEIQADLNNYTNQEPFEGYAMENACLYAYRVNEITYDNAPTEYLPLALAGENIIHSLEGCSLSDCSDCYLEEEGDLENYSGLPGVSVNCDDQEITIPNYLLDCHDLASIDDANYQGNWSPFFNGVRMRFDNAIRNLPGDFVVPIDELYSEPDTNLVYYLNRDDDLYGSIDLLYLATNFANKPAYDYQIELSTTPVDTAFKSTTDLNAGPEAACGRSFSTLLPFKIKNLTTGEYVKVLHSDDGIWNGISTEIPGWFDDTQPHPGDGDCVWSPGEWLTFELDPVKMGDSDEIIEQKTFKLQMSFNAFALYGTKISECLGYMIMDYDQAITYPANVCVQSEGLVWRATELISPQDGFIPNQWYDDDDETTELNDNPWLPIYPWNDGDKIILKPKRWFVDGDYWIANMSLLGKAEEIIQENLDEITVVPNPYITSSLYNETATSKQINFMHLPDECTITIYTISGELVDVINHGPGSIKSSTTWNLRNTYGKLVSPGLYVYRVETPNGLTKVNKFAIVR